MRRQDFGELNAFMVVAEERSFTRAAAKLGTSQSTLSQTIRRLETRLGLRLLTRSTRSVAPTEAGERLLETLRPAFDDIDDRLAALTEFREKPAGTVRINATDQVAESLLWPALKRLLADYPDIQIELTAESGLTDIVAGRYDAGVRLGELVDKDMIAVRIGPEMRMVAVASPAYFARNPTPLTPHDLAKHECINLRLPSLGGLYAWEFEKDGHELRVRVEGSLAFNSGRLIIAAALDGFGIGYVTSDYADKPVKDGRLMSVLEDWSPPFAGYHLYYPSRRQLTPAFALVVDALRYRRV
ncbi:MULTISPECIES: LysR family transcriptional regulator [Rhizobium]|uniref:LysR family transcriptional regulator n=1 Tax=Rhizobium indicum TaxID=2583231 RepID=A0ABX6PB93_9HYPH|nr:MULTISPECIES: LysR family transcriptional regulator [Rhizobium]MBA1348317.1 LysR family transcriptional regulator [Rhizobium sp. WYCCWR 11146]QKK15100.1 LysR family transcriptional regulator [Rhizobium indicum]QKK29131.1 LysR family transcriptional regulator [Rhizobium indicum]